MTGGLGWILRIWLEHNLPDLGLDVCGVIILGVGPDKVDRVVVGTTFLVFFITFHFLRIFATSRRINFQALFVRHFV